MKSQDNITVVVREYVRTYPREYGLFKGQNWRRRNAQNNKFASIRKGAGALERRLTEIPETLFGMFTANLSDKDLEYYKSKKGTRWFAGEFPDFRIAEII